MIPEDLPALPRELMPSFKSERTYFIFGAKSFRGRPGGPDVKAFNTAFFTDASGEFSGATQTGAACLRRVFAVCENSRFVPAMPLADGFTPGGNRSPFSFRAASARGPLICTKT